jgi:TolA-binding protein
MTTMHRIFLPLITIALLASCGGGGGTENEPMTAADSAAEASRRIRAQEDSLYSKPVFDRKGAVAIKDVYIAYVRRFPLDTMAPEYLFRAAGVISKLGDPQTGVDLYDRIIRDYPGWRRLVDTYYLKAFTLDNDMQLKGAAKTAYEEVIAKFPDHKFATESNAMIENLELTDQELIEKFQRMNAAKNDSLGSGT